MKQKKTRKTFVHSLSLRSRGTTIGVARRWGWQGGNNEQWNGLWWLEHCGIGNSHNEGANGLVCAPQFQVTSNHLNPVKGISIVVPTCTVPRRIPSTRFEHEYFDPTHVTHEFLAAANSAPHLCSSFTRWKTQSAANFRVVWRHSIKRWKSAIRKVENKFVDLSSCLKVGV